jgi:hypothetical protein|tara:strand:- start:865 stop:1500 length:636 start_codon:yes stop_codon:yes gene_type:complete
MSIENLKSTISKKGGLAPTNRFNVIFAPPAMSLLNINPQQIIGSLVSGGFSAGNLLNDPRDISILCKTVNIPGRTLTTFDHAHDRQQNKYPYTFIDEDVTMTFHLTNDYYMRNILERWQSGIFNTESYVTGFKNDYSVDVIIQQLNQKNIPVYGVKLLKAYPVSYEGIALDNAGENSVTEMSVTFAYDKFVPEGPLSSTGSAIRSAINTII